ncbi:hypothetical protein [Methermicoccus shengliensis]|uniref:Uncharacterized protein n=1 Tax=Methermicoccus shengliensis TaxID=660064 RepID=A0A832VNL5_9EURY|nr:hypothetical protein [Methermicoccus shengliensis]HIH70426.1 hypothetical protein [Methermicoccus shengliensis]
MMIRAGSRVRCGGSSRGMVGMVVQHGEHAYAITAAHVVKGCTRPIVVGDGTRARAHAACSSSRHTISRFWSFPEAPASSPRGPRMRGMERGTSW